MLSVSDDEKSKELAMSERELETLALLMEEQ